MRQNNTRVESHVCPDCGKKLSQDRDLLLCKDHGAFFSYGPQLLVRAPGSAGKSVEVQMPWELPRTSLA